MTKLPNIPPTFMLQIMLNNNTMFTTSFGTLEDMVSDNVWEVATTHLHEMLKKWVFEQAEKEAANGST